MVVLGGGQFSYERGTPVHVNVPNPTRYGRAKAHAANADALRSESAKSAVAAKAPSL